MSWHPTILQGRSQARSYKVKAPLLEDVEVKNLALDRSSPGWSTLIDTGAERTLIPLASLDYLGLKGTVGKVMTAVWPNGVRTNIPSVYVMVFHKDLGLIGPLLAGCVKRDSIILGRDSIAKALFVMDSVKSRFLVSKGTFWRSVARLLR
jgi:hypothetical protein